MYGSNVNKLLVAAASIVRSYHQSNCRSSVYKCCALLAATGRRRKASFKRTFQYDATRRDSYATTTHRAVTTTSTTNTRSTPGGNLLLCQMTAMMPQMSEGGFIDLPDKTSLPYLKQQQQGQSTCSSLNIIIAHGLGTDPPTKTHLNDISYDLWQDCLIKLESSSNSLSSIEANAKQGTTVLYTARGHGLSTGWDHAAIKKNEKLQNNEHIEDDFDEEDHLLAKPFIWPYLANDMAVVANKNFEQDTKFTIFGQSMGAMTALYYAFQEPERIQALILARPPRIWEQRQVVAQDYVQAAKDYRARQKQQKDGQKRYHHLPILGASLTDLPARVDGEKWNRLSTIPVLLLCHGDDENHPLESGSLLQRVISHSTLVDEASDETEARQMWPNVMSKWIIDKGLV